MRVVPTSRYILKIFTKRGDNVIANKRWKLHILARHSPSVLSPKNVKLETLSNAQPSKNAKVKRQSARTTARVLRFWNMNTNISRHKVNPRAPIRHRTAKRGSDLVKASEVLLGTDEITKIVQSKSAVEYVEV